MTDIRIAMWSGPRNLSSALMRSFANRADCAAWDEPFYAAYLAATRLDHPMADEVIAAGETDWRKVAERCLGPAPGGAPVFYQKHMSHHMIPGFGRDWIEQVTNAFLIRAPEPVLASYAARREKVELADIGFAQQRELFDRAADRLGAAPPVVEADDIRRDPERTLRALCAALGIVFDLAMLRWEPGPRPEDGVWGRHWYQGLWRSTSFAPPDDASTLRLPAPLARLAEAARPHYDALRRHRLRPAREEEGA